MSALLCFILFYSVNSELLQWDDVEVKEGVYILTDSNFDKVVNEVDTIMVKFFAPWCGHCKQMVQPYITAASEISQDEHPAYLAEVDATVNQQLAARFGIKGYPTLKLFKKGKPHDYEDARTTSAMVSYVRGFASPNYKNPIEYLNFVSDDNLTDYTAKKPCALVAVLDKSAVSYQQYEVMFSDVAKDLDGKCLIAVADSPLFQKSIKEYSVSTTPAYVLFKNGYQIKYHGESTVKNDFVSYLNDIHLDGSTLVSSSSELYDHLKTTHKNMESAVLGIFTDPTLYEYYVRALQDFRIRLTFFHITNVEHTNKLHKKIKEIVHNNKNAILVIHNQHLLSPEEPFAQILKGDALKSVKDITNFLEENSVPLVGFYTSYGKGKPNYDFSAKPSVKIFFECDFSESYLDEIKYVQSKIFKVASKHRDVLFALANENEHLDGDLKKLSFQNTPEDIQAGYFVNSTHRYGLSTSDFSSEVLERFVKDAKAGILKRKIFSESGVLMINQEQMYEVTANTWKDFIKHSNDSCILLAVYHRNCPDCGNVFYIMREFAKDSKIMVAKIDVSLNDVGFQFRRNSQRPVLHIFSNKTKFNPIVVDQTITSKDVIVSAVNEGCPKAVQDERKDEL